MILFVLKCIENGEEFNLWGHLMENVSKVITDYIEENIGDKQLKNFYLIF